MKNINTISITTSEAELTKSAIHKLLNTYPEFGMNQEYVAALQELPSGIIFSARNAGPIVARAMLNKALKWKDQLLTEYPDLAQRPSQFAMALEIPEEYLKDRSMGKPAGREYASRSEKRQVGIDPVLPILFDYCFPGEDDKK